MPDHDYDRPLGRAGASGMPARGYSWQTWQPGQSGNLSGQSHTRRSIRERLEKAADDLLIPALRERIQAGDTQAIIETLRQILGSPRQAVDVSTGADERMAAALQAVIERMGLPPALLEAPVDADYRIADARESAEVSAPSIRQPRRRRQKPAIDAADTGSPEP